MSGSPSLPPPSSPGQRRQSHQVGGRSHSPDEVDDEEVDHFQLHQDLDAARQMSRARANSASLHRHGQQGGGNAVGSPQLIPGSDNSGRRSHNYNSDALGTGAAPSQTPGNNGNYFGMSPNAALNSGGTQQGLSVRSASHSPTSPLNAYGSSQQHPAARFYMLQSNRHGSNSSNCRPQALAPVCEHPLDQSDVPSNDWIQSRMIPVNGEEGHPTYQIRAHWTMKCQACTLMILET
jgi:hypothetical protein